MPFIIVRDDLTKMHVDAVVNTTNVKLQQGNGGVSGAIFEAAGADSLCEACRKIGGCAFGNAVITHGFNLPAAHIIHTPLCCFKMSDRFAHYDGFASCIYSLKRIYCYECP